MAYQTAFIFNLVNKQNQAKDPKDARADFINAQNTHKIILEDILKATGKLGRQPHKGHLPS